MKVGKLNWDDLKQIIDDNKSVVRTDVRIRSGIGEDCSVIDFGEYECVVSTDPITGADKNIGKLAVNINCNDIASCGVEPMGILVTILVPKTATLQDIKNIMAEIDEETKKYNVEILGGHTEVTDAVNRIVVSCTAIGKGKKGSAVATSGAKIGDDIVVTKLLCMEGTSIIVNDHLHKVSNVLTLKEIEIAKDYVNSISVINEGRIAGQVGVNAMHDITEGGVLGALWEVAEASNLGFTVYNDKMPISDITYKICDTLHIDPLKFISSGSMLITVNNGKELVDKLNSKGIKATTIGKITESRGILVTDNIERDVLPPTRDELFSI
ncbi:MAG: AIR synthase family protein [Clostridium sp.]